jgi:integrase
MNLKDAISTVLEAESHHAATTRQGYRRHAAALLSHFGPETQLSQIASARIQDWLDGFRSELRPATVRGLQYFVSAVFEVGDASNPVRQIQAPTIPIWGNRNTLAFEQEAQLAKVLPPWAFSLVQFFLNTGLRRTEVFLLRPEDLFFWTEQIDGEGFTVGQARIGSERTACLNPAAARIAKAWLESAPVLRSEYVFGFGKYPSPNRRGQALGVEILRACRRLGILDVSIDTLRSTFAERALAGGAAPVHVAYQMRSGTRFEGKQYTNDQIWAPAWSVWSREDRHTPATVFVGRKRNASFSAMNDRLSNSQEPADQEAILLQSIRSRQAVSQLSKRDREDLGEAAQEPTSVNRSKNERTPTTEKGDGSKARKGRYPFSPSVDFAAALCAR